MVQYTDELILLYNKALDAASNFHARDMIGAPSLEDYTPVVYTSGRIFMFGDAEGHPLLGTTYISTSDLVWIDVDAGFARTVSRWYKLGTRADSKTGDILFCGRALGCVIADDKSVQRMLDAKAQEFRQLANW